VVAVAVVMAACTPRSARTGPPPPVGPPRIEAASVHQRTRWFDTNDPIRPAGSQQELVAGSYLLARLEETGYLVNLDPVPVGNLLHSTNVIALPPSGHAAVVVIVDYDTSSSAPSDGPALGTFLEIARALRAVDGHHSVEFAALGAEHIAANGGQVGGRSLIELLKASSSRPQIVRIGAVGSGSKGVSVAGPAASSVRSAGAHVHIQVATTGLPPNDVFTRAGFAETVVSGDISVGRVLLAFLATASVQ
jgi:hypothetical protein